MPSSRCADSGLSQNLWGNKLLSHSVLTNVVRPVPEAPIRGLWTVKTSKWNSPHTNDHNGELDTLDLVSATDGGHSYWRTNRKLEIQRGVDVRLEPTRDVYLSSLKLPCPWKPPAQISLNSFELMSRITAPSQTASHNAPTKSITI